MSKVITEIDSKVNELYSKTFVTQKILNDSENPIELKIYVYKKDNCIFSSFSAKIGDSITVKSKVIKKEKAEEKYSDSISSGNAAIFVSNDPDNNNRIIINMGNIPAKQELTFISEFISYTESSENYEFELFRNLPFLIGKESIYHSNVIRGQVEIKTKNKINKIDKKILSEKLKIIEEKHLNEEKKNDYLIKYEYSNLNKISFVSFDFKENYEDLDYIPSSKIYFDFEENVPTVFSQKSSFDEKEENYIIQYRNVNKKTDSEDKDSINPALFIFLIDQSGSMSGNAIKVASKALLLFIQSLPAGSYYQIIGFGSNYKKYDEEPKEYVQENIQKSIQLIEQLKADLGGTDIYSPLKDIYNSDKIYEKINLPRNIFLLTDGDIENKKDTLSLIEKYSDKYSIYSIGIGNSFDKDLIKNAGIIGKGNYNFCYNIEGLNEVIATEVSNASSPYISNFNLISPFDNNNKYKLNLNDIIIKKNKIINYSYILEKKEKEENTINENKINIEIKYIEKNRNIEKNDEKNGKNEKFEIVPEILPVGEELSKLIINNYILTDSNLNEEEKLKLALKYQIQTENTSLFAEVELSEQINDEMKQKIIGDKEDNQFKKRRHEMPDELFDPSYDLLMECESSSFSSNKCYSSNFLYSSPPVSFKKKFSISGIFKNLGNSIKGLFSFWDKSPKMFCNEIKISSNEEKENKEVEKEEKKEIKKEQNLDLNLKEDIMKIINTQDFVGGSWDINDSTKIIKEKYGKEFELLKNLKGKNIDDKIAITILIIYFINKEQPQLLKELVMIIKKGKLFIQEKTKDTYENIIKEIGI